MKKELAVGTLVVALTIGFAATATAESEDTDVEVTVSSDVAIDVQPSQLNYSDGVNPGEFDRESDEGYQQLEIRNIGSESLNEIYAEVTNNADNPFGTDEDLDHNTGNFVQLWTEAAVDGDYGDLSVTDISTPHYVTRVEHNVDPIPTYLDIDDSGNVNIDGVDVSNDEQSVGRFRVGDVEYYFVTYSQDTVDEVGIMIGQTPHTPTSLGTTDFTEDSEDVIEEQFGSGDNVDEVDDVFQVSGQEFLSFDTSEYNSGEPVLDDEGDVLDDLTDAGLDDDDEAEEREYNVLFDFSTDDEFTQALRTRWDVDPEDPGAGDGWTVGDLSSDSGTNYIVETSSESSALQPDQNFPVDIGVEVPLGVDRDQIEEGALTIIASEYE